MHSEQRVGSGSCRRRQVSTGGSASRKASDKLNRTGKPVKWADVAGRKSGRGSAIAKWNFHACFYRRLASLLALAVAALALTGCVGGHVGGLPQSSGPMRVIMGPFGKDRVVRSGGYLVFNVDGRVWGNGARKYPSAI